MAYQLIFFVNGKKVIEGSPDPEQVLVQYLRDKLLLTGTKKACGQGGCGACTVMISRYDRRHDIVRHYAVNACRMPICSLHGLAVTTVEGVGSTRTGLHPIQERLAQFHASQCGFCTPGMLMSMYTLLRTNHSPTVQHVEAAVEGNLCRCTGYRSILASFNSFTQEMQCGMGDKCCKLKQEDTKAKCYSDVFNLKSEFVPYDPSQEAIFPSELKLSDTLDRENLTFVGKVRWHRPVSIDQLLAIKALDPTAKLVGGCNEVDITRGIFPVLVSISRVPELCVVEQTDFGLRLGAALTFTEIVHEITDVVTRLPAGKTGLLSCFLTVLQKLPGQQLRNSATIGGHIMAANSASHLNTLLLVSKSLVTVLTTGGEWRQEVMDESFFVESGKTRLVDSDILVSVTLPFTAKTDYIEAFQIHKQASHGGGVVNVNAAMKVSFNEDSDVISELALSFGGVRSTAFLATHCTRQLIGRKWEKSLIGTVASLLLDELRVSSSPPDGASAYKETLAVGFFFKFFTSVQKKLKLVLPDLDEVAACDESCISSCYHGDVQSTQIYEQVSPDQHENDLVGRPIAIQSARTNATGESIFLDDIQPRRGELYLALVLSAEAHARILRVDQSESRKIPGFVDYIDASDIPGVNRISPYHAEEVFCTDKVSCHGQTIGAVVAQSQMTALKAAAAIIVEYEKLPAILSLQEAITAESFLAPTQQLICGNVESGWQTSTHVCEGEVYIGGQEHFYMETHGCLAIPAEEGAMEIIAGVQHPKSLQQAVATVLGIPSSKVVCRVKRVGGAFGGKETRHLASLPTAVAAYKLGQPVRCILERSTDMAITGGRHPFLAKYKVGFNDEGRISALEVDLYADGGCTADLTAGVVAVAMVVFDNGTKIENIILRGHSCRTNLASNTGFRGFGAPQGMFIMQTCLQHIAEYLQLAPHQVTRLNLYEEGDFTNQNQRLTNCTLPRCWQQVLDSSNFQHRALMTDQFNRCNKWKKRGIAIVPVKFLMGIGTVLFLHQAGALVNVYTDGTVLIAHGGCELGQGIHTKMIQIASRCLQVAPETIHINETNTNTVPNASPTYGSICSDLNGGAVKNACEEILRRLAPYKAAAPNANWNDWVMAAYMDRVNLSATGFYKTEDKGYDMSENKGQSCTYYSYGVGCSEVEIDCLTGDHTVLRCDLVMDVGRSLNPAIDIGQIEGAFMQGYGLFTMEELQRSATGRLTNTGPSSYRLPHFSDLPAQFNVSLLEGATNPHAVYSSKGIGEPPLFLAASIFFAIKNAILAAREDSGIRGPFRLDSPATVQRIRMACLDEYIK